MQLLLEEQEQQELQGQQVLQVLQELQEQGLLVQELLVQEQLGLQGQQVVHYCTLSLSDNWVSKQIITTDSQCSIQRLSRWVTN